MERDDAGFYGACVFVALLALTVPLLAFALLRVCRHLRSAQSFPVLLVFYGILAFFLLCRLVYFLDVFCNYDDWVYYSLDLLPVVFIFTAASMVVYLWHQIAEEFLAPYGPPSKALNAYCYWTIGSNLLYYILFFVPFLILYPLDPLVAA
jgi:hypothetical protein